MLENLVLVHEKHMCHMVRIHHLVQRFSLKTNIVDKNPEASEGAIPSMNRVTLCALLIFLGWHHSFKNQIYSD